MKELFGNIGIGVLCIFILVFSVIYSAFTLTILWAWFIIPIFGLKALTIIQAIGLSLFIGYIKGYKDEEKTNGDFIDKFLVAHTTSIIYTTIYLLLGCILVILFM